MGNARTSNDYIPTCPHCGGALIARLGAPRSGREMIRRRNAEIVRLHDDLGWDFVQLGIAYGMTSQGIGQAYRRTKKRTR